MLPESSSTNMMLGRIDVAVEVVKGRLLKSVAWMTVVTMSIEQAAMAVESVKLNRSAWVYMWHNIPNHTIAHSFGKPLWQIFSDCFPECRNRLLPVGW